MRVVAEAAVFTSTEPSAANNSYNVSNGDTFRWSRVSACTVSMGGLSRVQQKPETCLCRNNANCMHLTHISALEMQARVLAESAASTCFELLHATACASAALPCKGWDSFRYV